MPLDPDDPLNDPLPDCRAELARIAAEIARLTARADFLREQIDTPALPLPRPRPGWPIRRCGTAA